MHTNVLAVPVLFLTRNDAVTNTFLMAAVIGITDIMSVVELIGPRVLLTVKFRDRIMLHSENIRREARHSSVIPLSPPTLRK